MWLTRKTPIQKTHIADDRLRMSAERFEDFAKKLKVLKVRVQLFYSDLQRTYKSRTLMMDALQEVSRESPLQELVVAKRRPQPEDDEEDEEEEEKRPKTYASVAQDAHMSAQQLSQYHRDIVSYVAEWETTVSTRVATELKHIASLHKTYEKYRMKHEMLINAKHKNEDKITWNESKLRTARKEYRRNLIAVTLLTEEVTDRGWKDLVPLLIRMIDFDVNHISSNSKELLRALATIREEMVNLSRRYEMDFEALHKGRLRILREEDAADFVNPEDLQDLESTIVHSFGDLGVVNTLTPTSSDRDSHSTVEVEQQSTMEKPTEVVLKEDVKKDDDNDAEDNDDDNNSCSNNPNYPSSIYLLCGEGAAPVDDETTLTGQHDLVSV